LDIQKFIWDKYSVSKYQYSLFNIRKLRKRVFRNIRILVFGYCLKYWYPKRAKRALNIDELDAVGANFKGLDMTPVTRTEKMERAGSADNRTLRGDYDNKRKREFSVIEKQPAARTAISVVDDPNALLDRRFSEVKELNTVFEEAKASVKNWESLSPGDAKKRINAKVWDIIRNGSANEAVADAAGKIRDAMAIIGIEDSPDGFRLAQRNVKRPPPEKLYSEEPPKTTSAPEPTTPAPVAPAEPVAPQAAAAPAAGEQISINSPEEPGVSAPGAPKSVVGKLSTGVAIGAGAADVYNQLEAGDVKGAARSGAVSTAVIAGSEWVPGFGEVAMPYGVLKADTPENKRKAEAAGMRVLEASGQRTDVYQIGNPASEQAWGDAADAYWKARAGGALWGGLIQPTISAFSLAGKNIYARMTHPTTYGYLGL
jgi:hypothetical protein